MRDSLVLFPSRRTAIVCVCIYAASLAFILDGSDKQLILAIYVFAMALLEELVFRKWMAVALFKRYGLVVATVGSTLVFAAVHGPHAPMAFVVGLVFALLYFSTGSIWPAAFYHAAHNNLVRSRDAERYAAQDLFPPEVSSFLVLGVLFFLQLIYVATVAVWYSTIRRKASTVPAPTEAR